MSIQARDAVYGRSNASGYARLVLLAFAEVADADGVAWPSMSRIAEMQRMPRETASRNVKALVKSGDLIPTGGTRRGAKVYRIGAMSSGKGVTQDHAGCDAGSHVTQDHSDAGSQEGVTQDHAGCDAPSPRSEPSGTVTEPSAVAREPDFVSQLLSEVETIARADSSKHQHWAMTGISSADAWLSSAKASGIGPERAIEVITAKVREVCARDPQRQIAKPGYFSKAISDAIRHERTDRPKSYQRGTFGTPKVTEGAR